MWLFEPIFRFKPIGEFLFRIRQQDGSTEIGDQIKKLLYNNEDQRNIFLKCGFFYQFSDLNPIGEFLSRIRQQDGSAEIVDQIKVIY